MSQDHRADNSTLTRAIARLMSLHEGYAGVTDIIACGRDAVPMLRALLFRTEMSGIFELRCRAISALAALGSSDVLVEFLSELRSIADPVARAGEEAVISTAARALIGVRDGRIFAVLMRIAERRSLAGVIEALGATRCPQAIPALVRALCEDESRRAAEAALRQIGDEARPALLRAALTPRPDSRHEATSSVRGRRAAARLLVQIGLKEETQPAAYVLVWDLDPEVAAYASEATLRAGAPGIQDHVVVRLTALLPALRSPVREAASACLAEYRQGARSLRTLNGPR